MDQSHTVYDRESLMRQYRGSLIESYVKRFDGRELSATEEKAFVYGMEALMASRRNSVLDHPVLILKKFRQIPETVPYGWRKASILYTGKMKAGRVRSTHLSRACYSVSEK